MENPREALAKIVQGEEYRLLQASFASQTGNSTVMLFPGLRPLSRFSRPPEGRPDDLFQDQACCLKDDTPFKSAVKLAAPLGFCCLECKSEVTIHPILVDGVLAGFGCLIRPSPETPLAQDSGGLAHTFSAWVNYMGNRTKALLERNRAEMDAEKRAAKTKGRLQRLELALWGSGLALWDWNMETDEVYRSSDWARMQGYEPEEVEHTLETWRGMIHPADREKTLSYLESFRRGLVDTYESDFRVMRKDGTHHWVRERGKIVERNGVGKPIRSVGTLRDIDQRERLARALEENRRKLETLLSNLPGMAYRCRVDLGWTLEFASQGCKELTGFEPEQVMNSPDHTFAHMIHKEDLPAVRAKVQSALEAHKPFSLTYRLITADGNTKWVSEQGVGLWDKNGEIVALEGFISDISGQKEAESDKLNKAKLEAAMQTAGAACHELNQPLQSLMLRLELCLLRTERGDPMAAELARMLSFAEIMAGITKRLSRITMFRTSRYLGNTRILDLGKKE